MVCNQKVEKKVDWRARMVRFQRTKGLICSLLKMREKKRVQLGGKVCCPERQVKMGKQRKRKKEVSISSDVEKKGMNFILWEKLRDSAKKSVFHLSTGSGGYGGHSIRVLVNGTKGGKKERGCAISMSQPLGQDAEKM